MAISDIRSGLQQAVAGPSTTVREAGLTSLLGRLAQEAGGVSNTVYGDTASAGGEFAALTAQLAGLRATTEQQATLILDNTRAMAENTAVSARSVTQAVGNAVSGAARGGVVGLGLPSLISGLVNALRGSDQPQVPLPLLTQPAPIRVEAALPTASEPNFAPVTLDQAGFSRRSTVEPVVSTPVTIQVNTMDSRSFLDHSDEIARAVRHALLNTHSLRDVVGEL
ncbi:MAG: hypothetical protein R2762_10365 [Bryobacteraceae bacterium]